MWEATSTLLGIILVITLVNLCIFGVVHRILQHTTSRAIHAGLPLLVMAAGYLISMNADPANLIIGTYFFVAPMVVLMAADFIPGLADPVQDFTRVFLCNFFQVIIAVIFLGFVISSQYLNTAQYYRNIAVSNAITYLFIAVFDLILAVIIFSLMRARRTYPAWSG